MAIDFDYEFHAAQTKGLWGLKLLARLAPARRAINPLLRAIAPTTPHPLTAPCVVTENFDNAAEHYQKHKWAFVENVFSDDFHIALKRNLPPRRYLEPVRDLTKGYDLVKITKQNREQFSAFSELMAAMDYLSSPEFAQRMSEVTGLEGLQTTEYINFTKSHPGTYVVPHRDQIYIDGKSIEAVNIVFFVDGTGGSNSGGLALTDDNEYKSVIFEPMNLVNTCLIYDMKAPFYHGFLPIAKNKFRHALIKNWKVIREEQGSSS